MQLAVPQSGRVEGFYFNKLSIYLGRDTGSQQGSSNYLSAHVGGRKGIFITTSMRARGRFLPLGGEFIITHFLFLLVDSPPIGKQCNAWVPGRGSKALWQKHENTELLMILKK